MIIWICSSLISVVLTNKPTQIIAISYFKEVVSSLSMAGLVSPEKKKIEFPALFEKKFLGSIKNEVEFLEMIKKKIWGISNHGSWFLPCCEWNGMLNFQLKLRLRLLFSIKGKVTNQKIAGVFFKKVCPQPPSPPSSPPPSLWIYGFLLK